MLRRDSAALFVCIMVVVPLMVLSCATHRDASNLREELHVLSTTTESRLSAIEASVSFIDSMVQEQYALSMGIRAQLGSQSRDERDNLTSLVARQDEINYQLRELLKTLQAIQLYGGISSSSTEEPAATSDPAGKTADTPAAEQDKKLMFRTSAGTIEAKPEELYRSAIEDINKGNFAFAESRLLTFLIEFPKHELAGNAQYWLGETAYGQKKFELAITEFDKVRKNYRKSPKVPAALLKKGYAQIEIGQIKSARTTLKNLINSYPKSEEAKLAREKLELL